MVQPNLEFDDVLYHLQVNRGASVYWRHISHDVATARPDWWIVSRPGSRLTRFSPVRSSARVFHSSLFRVALGRSIRNVMTVHDLAYERGLVPDGLRTKAALAQRRACVRAADGLVFISAQTRDEFHECYPQKERVPSVVAWHGRDPEFDVHPSDEPSPFPTSYVIHVGHREGYKNFQAALEGFVMSELPGNGISLVCLGPEFSTDERTTIAGLGMDRQVVWLSAPSRGDLGRFLRHALALVYVSTCEGFGMPLVESMQSGTPIIAGNASCLPEVGGDAPLYVDPSDPSAIAAGLNQIQDPDRRTTLTAAGYERVGAFTWQSSVAQHIELYEQLGAGAGT